MSKALLVRLLILLISSLFLYLLVASPIRKLRDSNELYYGGDRNIVEDTIQSLIQQSVFFRDADLSLVFYSSVITLTVIGASILYWVFIFIKKKQGSPKAGIVFSLLMFIPLASLVLQHTFLGTKYIIDRTALFLLLLLWIQVLYSLYFLTRSSIWVSRFLAGFLTLVVSYNFLININLHSSRSWWMDTHNVTVLKRILEDNEGKKIKLRVNWNFMPSMNYYISTFYQSSFYPLEYIKEAPGPDTSYDYIYVTDADRTLISPIYAVDTSFSEGFVLLKKR
jgi:hypothetical protein